MKKKKIGYNVLVIILFAIVCFLTVYIIVNRKVGSDCASIGNVTVDNKESSKEKTNNISTSITYPKVDINYTNDEPAIEVNNNNVVLDEKTLSVSNITVFKDIVVFIQSDTDMSILTFVDSNGNIIKTISYDDVIGNKISNYEIKDNSIYITSHKLAQDDIAVVCNLKAQNKNEDVVYTEKMEYLGNGKFSDLVLENIIKSDDYIKNNNINCSQIGE